MHAQPLTSCSRPRADTEPGPSPEVVEERGRCVSSQLRVVSVVAQLLHAPRTLGYRHFRWLAAHLVSRMMSYGPEVSDLLRELFRELRAGRSAIMPEVYMGAMKVRVQWQWLMVVAWGNEGMCTVAMVVG